MAIDTTNKYVTTTGLKQFLAKIKDAYASNTSTAFKVNHAISADNDGSGNSITSTYYTKADFNTFKSDYDTFYNDTTGYKYDKIWSIYLKGNPNDKTYSSYKELTPDASTKRVNIDLSAYALLSDITSVFQYKGTVATKSDLPTTGVKVGDVYVVQNGEAYDTSDTDGTKTYIEKNVEYVCQEITSTGTIVWEKLGTTYDFSAYAEKTYVDAKIKEASDTLSGDTTALATRVTTAEGKITTIQGQITTLNGADTVDGSVKKTATTIANTVVNNKIDTLNYTYSGTTGELVTDVSESKGIISVTKGSLSIAGETDIANLFT